MKEKLKKLKTKNKIYNIGIIIFLLLIVINGIKSVYAYYNETAPSISMLASEVGDFDSGDGDINIVIYKANDSTNKIYTKSYSIPEIGYELNKKECSIDCSEGTDGACHYQYDKANKRINLTSNKKVTCKFYFDKQSESDINVYIMLQDENGAASFEGANYRNVNNIPAYGYSFYRSTCDQEGITAEYNPETKTFKVETTKKTTCYAYFQESGSSDVTTRVFIEDIQTGQPVLSNTIPANKIYTKVDEKSYCYAGDTNARTSATIEYVNGEIKINNINQKQTCDIYLKEQQ